MLATVERAPAPIQLRIANRDASHMVPVTSIIPGFNTTGLANAGVASNMDTRPKVGKPWPTNFMQYLMKSIDHEATHPPLAKRKHIDWLQPFRGQTVVDLGAGAQTDCYHLARILEAKGYLAVEGHNSESLLQNMRNAGEMVVTGIPHKFFPEKPLIPASLVGEDMLTTLKRIPSNSVSVIASGIDIFIVLGDGDFLREVENEVNRVLDPAGLFLAYHSNLSLNEPSNQEEAWDNDPYMVKYTKKQERPLINLVRV